MTEINFQPLADMILVRPDPPEEMEGRIFIPEKARKEADEPGDYMRTYTGVVVAVGPGDQFRERRRSRPGGKSAEMVRTLINQDGSRLPMLTKVGDRVLYPARPNAPGGYARIVIDGEEFDIFNEEQNALAVIEE